MNVRVVPERPPETGRAEREERSHEDGQGSAHPQGDMEHGLAGRTILLDEVPGRLLIEVLVSQARELDPLFHRILQVDVLEVLPYFLPLVLDRADHLLVRGIEKARGRDGVVEVLVREGQRAVHEVSVYREEFAVV